jgi:hypothetical protein
MTAAGFIAEDGERIGGERSGGRARSPLATVRRTGYRAAGEKPITFAESGVVMKGLGLLVCALIFAPGCASEGGKSPWDDFWKDLRGDNMEMKCDFTGSKGLADSPAQQRARDDNPSAANQGN